jgi:hypothetical protein
VTMVETDGGELQSGISGHRRFLSRPATSCAVNN